jgi:hypothetical protein
MIEEHCRTLLSSEITDVARILSLSLPLAAKSSLVGEIIACVAQYRKQPTHQTTIYPHSGCDIYELRLASFEKCIALHHSPLARAP